MHTRLLLKYQAEIIMHFEAEPATARAVIIHIGKTLDFANAEDFSHLCQDVLADGYQHFILDFSRTGILDSTGLGAIMQLRQQVAAEGRIVFASLSEAVRVVVQLTRIYREFALYPSVQAACKALS